MAESARAANRTLNARMSKRYDVYRFLRKLDQSTYGKSKVKRGSKSLTTAVDQLVVRGGVLVLKGGQL